MTLDLISNAVPLLSSSDNVQDDETHHTPHHVDQVDGDDDDNAIEHNNNNHEQDQEHEAFAHHLYPDQETDPEQTGQLDLMHQDVQQDAEVDEQTLSEHAQQTLASAAISMSTMDQSAHQGLGDVLLDHARELQQAQHRHELSSLESDYHHQHHHHPEAIAGPSNHAGHLVSSGDEVRITGQGSQPELITLGHFEPQEFLSFDDLYEHVASMARDNGFSVSIYNPTRSKKGVLRAANLRCSKSGKHRETRTADTRRRKAHTSKTDCPFNIYAHRTDPISNKFTFDVKSGEHNHVQDFEKFGARPIRRKARSNVVVGMGVGEAASSGGAGAASTSGAGPGKTRKPAVSRGAKGKVRASVGDHQDGNNDSNLVVTSEEMQEGFLMSDETRLDHGLSLGEAAHELMGGQEENEDHHQHQHHHHHHPQHHHYPQHPFGLDPEVSLATLNDHHQSHQQEEQQTYESPGSNHHPHHPQEPSSHDEVEKGQSNGHAQDATMTSLDPSPNSPSSAAAPLGSSTNVDPSLRSSMNMNISNVRTRDIEALVRAGAAEVTATATNDAGEQAEQSLKHEDGGDAGDGDDGLIGQVILAHQKHQQQQDDTVDQEIDLSLIHI